MANEDDHDTTSSQDKTSWILQQLLADLPTDTVPVGFLVEQLHGRSFGGVLIVLSLIGLVPGVSIFSGLAMLVPGIQMMLGYDAPQLPKFLHRRTINRTNLQLFGKKLIPWLQKVEHYVRPRWSMLTVAPFPNLLGFVVVALALVIMLPLPFSNLPPAIALTCLSLGILERDGLLVGIGLVCAIIALGIGMVLASVAIKSLLLLF